MKLANVTTSRGIRAALIDARGQQAAIDLDAAGVWQGPAPVRLDQLEALRGTVDGPRIDLTRSRLAPAVLTPGKIICVGLNYRRHAAESKMAIPTRPVLFAKYANSLAAQGQPVPMPGVDDQIDYEAELAVVIGRRAKHLAEADALGAVLGYCCANDLSARAAQLATSQWMAGKMLDAFLPLGPWLVTADEVPDPQALGIRCFVNGHKRQDSNTSDMIFSVAQIVSFVSRHATLEPGDVIITGTPEGVVMGMAEKAWLRAGDEVSVEIDGLGRLTNTLTEPTTTVHHGVLT